MKVHKVLRLHHAQHFPNCGASQLFPHGDKLRLRIQTKQHVKPSVMLGHDVTKLAGNYRERSAITKYASSNKRRLSAKNLDTNVSKEKKEHPRAMFSEKKSRCLSHGKAVSGGHFQTVGWMRGHAKSKSHSSSRLLSAYTTWWILLQRNTSMHAHTRRHAQTQKHTKWKSTSLFKCPFFPIKKKRFSAKKVIWNLSKNIYFLEKARENKHLKKCDVAAVHILV